MRWHGLGAHLRRAVVFGSAAALAACVTTPLPGVPVQEAEAAAVQGCRPLGELSVSTLRDSGSPAADLQRVRERLLSDARERGATHLVVTERDLRFALALARGIAYRCD